jgi:hypothetical protein
MLPPVILASRMILSQAREALQATGREVSPIKAQDQLPEKEKKAPQEGKPKPLKESPGPRADYGAVGQNTQSLYFSDSQRNRLS